MTSTQKSTTNPRRVNFFRPALWIMLAFLSILAGKAHSYDVDPSSFLAMSKTCQEWYVNAFAQGKVTGMDLSGIPSNPNAFKRKLGSAATWMNHYCPGGVTELIRLQTRYYGALDEADRRRRLRKVLENLQYQLTRTGRWDNIEWFKAEVHNHIGLTYELAGKQDEAEESYRAAIEAYAPNLIGYWKLAELMVAQNRLDEAEAMLKTAAKVTSSSSHLARIKGKLDELDHKRAEQQGSPASQAAEGTRQ